MTSPPSSQNTEGTDWAILLSRVSRNGDREAFALLFEYFAPRIKGYLLRSGCSQGQAEELAQETMLAVWRKAAQFDPRTAGAAGWIFTIARNRRIDAHRRGQREALANAPDAEAAFQFDDAPAADAQLSATESDARVQSALRKLSDEQMKVIELSFFDDRAHGEIAEILGIPLGTVKSRLRLAMKRLRGMLGEES